MRLHALRRPVPPTALAAGAASVAAGVALYCLLYTWLAGDPESPAEAAGWAIANVLPWLFAIEAGKRAPSWAAAAGCLLVALAASVAAGYLLAVNAEGLAFEMIRRIPAVALSGAAVTLLRSGLGGTPSTPDIPLLPRQIDWIRAAGNYIEIRTRGRTVVHRSSIGAAERSLARHGFVRIHRSTLVRRDRIARIRMEDVVLDDGTHLKIGKRYRTALTS